MVKIDTEWLLEALDDNDPLVEHYLDTQTGDILRINEMIGIMEEQEELYKQMEQDPERWVTIDPISSRDGFRIMEAFVADLPDSENKRMLEKVLTWKKPFSNFRQALQDMPEIREKWFAFHHECMLRAAREWLQNSDINAELK